MSFYFPANAYNVLTGGNLTASPTTYTMATWVKPYDTSNRWITCRCPSGGPTSGWTHQLLLVSGVWQHYVYDGSTRYAVGTTSVVANTWYHVVICATNGGTVKLYVNGRSEGTPPAVGTMWTGGDRWYFCGPNDGSGYAYFNGELAYLTYWNVELTAEEIRRLYNTSRLSVTAIRPQNMYFNFPMNDLSSGTGVSSDWNDLVRAPITQARTGTPIVRADILSAG